MVRKKYIKFCICLLAVLGLASFRMSKFFKKSTKVYGSSDEVKKYTSNLPFKFSKIKETKFENKEFNIKNYGAREGNNVKIIPKAGKVYTLTKSSGYEFKNVLGHS